MSSRKRSKTKVKANSAVLSASTLAPLQNNLLGTHTINSRVPLQGEANSDFVTLNEALLSNLYVNSPIVQRVIRQPVEDALRGGVTISCEELGDETNNILNYLEDTGIFDSVKNAFIWSRLYGGAGIFINIDCSESYEELSLDNINSETEVELYDLNRWDLQKDSYFVTYNTLQTKETEFYTIRGTSEKIHKSRLIEIKNKATPRYLRGHFQGWGVSEVEKLKSALNSYNKSLNVLFELTDEAKIDIFSIFGLKDELEKPDGASKIIQMIHTNNYLKNYKKALVLDSEDSFEQKTINFAGVNSAGENARSALVTASEFNRSKILGEHASNFSNDASSTEDYNALVSSSVREPMKKVLRRIIEIVMKKLFGKVYDFEIEFKSLRILSALDEEIIKEKKRKGIIEFLSNGIIDRTEARDLAKRESLI